MATLLAVTTVTTTVAINAPSSAGAPNLNQADDVVQEGNRFFRWVRRSGTCFKEYLDDAGQWIQKNGSDVIDFVSSSADILMLTQHSTDARTNFSLLNHFL